MFTLRTTGSNNSGSKLKDLKGGKRKDKGQIQPSTQTIREEENNPPICLNFWILGPRKLHS